MTKPYGRESLTVLPLMQLENTILSKETDPKRQTLCVLLYLWDPGSDVSFMVLEGAVQAARNKKQSIVLPRCKDYEPWQ
ncbi:E130114P18Rik [Phodopus roborovskii]|uniref:E130114P18Rik protein n=1 Tax=Phodopus roborovskii TaxID=109678 RepID=A0AAU9YZ20_PHORO|nr:E130114P18Rik [Phodopus roborovskii]